MNKKNTSLHKIEKIFNKNGNIYKLTDSVNHNIRNIGESYISNVKYNKIKAWKYHKKINLNFVVIKGKVEFITFDNVKFRRYVLDDRMNNLLFIPKKIWYGFRGLKKNISSILSYASNQIVETEILRKNTSDIKYSWKKIK